MARPVLLRDVPPEINPDVVLLGCGDPRNILYTVHTSNLGHSSTTQKVDITCCDHEPAVLARNILFLALLLRDDYDRIKVGIWNSFYHFFVDDRCLKIIVTQSQILAELSKDFETWNSGRYADVIQIGTRFTLEELHKHWTLYAAAERWSAAKKRDLKKQFRSAIREHEKKLRGFVMGAPARSAGPMWPNAALAANEAYHRFWESGTANTDVEQDHTADLATNVNPLFAYATGQEGFFVHRATCPVVPFLLAQYFNPLGNEPASRPNAGGLNVLARIQCFRWCDSFRSCVQQPNRLTLRVIVGDALAFCRTLQQYKDHNRRTAGCRVSPWRAPLLTLDGPCYSSPSTSPLTFDVIDTSNLWDHVGVLNILVFAAPLLRPCPWAVLYTQVTADYGEDSTKDFLKTLFSDIDTFSILFDLAPVAYLSGFRTDCNSQNLLAPYIAGNNLGHIEPIPWKRPSTLASPQARSLPLKMSGAQLLDWIFDFHEKMFFHESLSPSGESPASQRERSRLHYSRGSLTMVLAHLVRRIDVDWDELLTGLLARMNLVDRMFPRTLSSMSVADFGCQMHLLGLYSHPSLHPMYPELQFNRYEGKFNDWVSLPAVVCIAVSVPRSVLNVLDDEQAGHNPGISAAIGSSRASHHFISSVESFHGSFVVEGTGENARAYINEDPRGRGGNSPVVMTFCVPTYVLTREPYATQVRFSVISTPFHADLYYKFDIGRFHIRRLMDNDVFVLGRKPTVRGDLDAPLLPAPPVPRARAAGDSPTVVLDAKREHITTMATKVVVADPAMKKRFADRKNAVSYETVSPCEMKLLLASQELLTVVFPYPVDMEGARLRVSREGWIEVIASPTVVGKNEGDLAFYRFPVLRESGAVTPWNIHRVWLDRLPRLSTAHTHCQQIQWVKKHSTFAFSDKENALIQSGTETDPLTHLKKCISSILGGFIGSAESEGVKIASILGPNESVECLVLTVAVCLDLSSHTVVADAFVVPKHGVSLDLLQVANLPHIDVRFNAAQLTAWKYLLPALAERCRDWTHRDDCELGRTAHVPRLLPPGELPLCACGKGHVTDAFREQTEWAPWAPHATRIALSPLFAVSYLEPTLQDIEPDQFVEILQEYHGIPESVLVTLRMRGGRIGQDYSKTICSGCFKWIPRVQRKQCGACKVATYCSAACQRSDWRVHKTNCSGRRVEQY